MDKFFLNSFASNILQSVTVFLFQFFLLHVTSPLKWYIPIPQDKSNFVKLGFHYGLYWASNRQHQTSNSYGKKKKDFIIVKVPKAEKTQVYTRKTLTKVSIKISMNFPKADLKKWKYELLFITRIRNIAIAIATIFSETQYSSRSSYPEMYLKNCVLKIFMKTLMKTSA